jgi:hypothetical protein
MLLRRGNTILRQGFMFFEYERCAALALLKRIWGNQFPQTPSQRLPALRPCAVEFR